MTRDLYLGLMERALLGLIYCDPPVDPWYGVVRNEQGEIVKFGEAPGTLTIEPGPFNLAARLAGADWPRDAHTMIGLARLQNIRAQLERVIAGGVPGDFVETGVWRGGACIYARAILKAHLTDRKVWVCDSFEGLPVLDRRYPADERDWHYLVGGALAVSQAQVETNFDRYGLLDEQVRFVKGWFSETLPKLPVEQIAVLRLDGDMYGSTIDAISALYDKVPVGGGIIVDDYNAVKGCHLAIDDFRKAREITDAIQKIDSYSVHWIKEG